MLVLSGAGMRRLAVFLVDALASVVGAAIDAASELWDLTDDEEAGPMWEDEE